MFFVFQNERTQVITTNLWVVQVRSVLSIRIGYTRTILVVGWLHWCVNHV